jgi:polyhydroxybutyrate depolymerase
MMRDWTTFDEQAGAFGDVAFLRALIDTVAGRHGTHPDRAVAGVSNGAFMAHRIALEASEKVAVFAAVAGGLPARLRDAGPAHAVSAMLIHGTADPVSPIEGGYSRHRGLRSSTPPRRSAASPSRCSFPRSAGVYNVAAAVRP